MIIDYSITLGLPETMFNIVPCNTICVTYYFQIQNKVTFEYIF